MLVALKESVPGGTVGNPCHAIASCSRFRRPSFSYLSARGIDPLALYAAAIDSSDYVARLIPVLRRLVPSPGDLLDVGAGAGQLGRAFHQASKDWTAIEPAPLMQLRLLALDDAPAIVARGWAEADVPASSYDTVLAANMPAPLQHPDAFLDRCRDWSRRSVVWIVPAQRGPHDFCLAGCLPPEWQGESRRSALETVLLGLGADHQPALVEMVRWTFVLRVEDVDALADHVATRLAWATDDSRRRGVRDHLAAQLRHGYLEVPKVSAVLVWDAPEIK